MSVKNNGIALAAAAAVGVTLGPLGPVVESLLNDAVVSDAKIVAFDKAGRSVMFVTVAVDGGAPQARVVADSSGNVRVFGNAAAAVAALKRAAPAAVATYTPYVAPATVGDPIKALIAKHKAAKVEATKAADALNKPQTGIAASIAAADALGWDEAANGTPEKQEWDDLQSRQASVTEWKAKADALVTSYTASLVAAGIDPVTYLQSGG